MVVRAAIERLDAGASFVLVCTCDPAWIESTVTARAAADTHWETLSADPGVTRIRVERRKT